MKSGKNKKCDIVYKLYIDYGKGYENAVIKKTLEEAYNRLSIKDYERYILIKRENNTDDIIDFGKNDEEIKQYKKKR